MIMKKKLTLFLLLTISLLGFSQNQSQTIKGTIVDEWEVPLAGVNVLVEGTTTGTQTDFDGNYTITASSGAVLTYSFIGMKTQSVTVGVNSTINITMIEETSELDEIVVIGYGTQKKADLTGSISSISGEGLDKIQAGDASQLLLGRMSGVRVESAGGSPGAPTNIVIRGVSSLTSSGPLFVID